MRLRRSLRLLAPPLSAIPLVTACATRPPRALPAAAESATASTLALASLQATPGADLAEPGPGRVLVYRAITGHLPYRETTPEGAVIYHARTRQERERLEAARLEEELRRAREREDLAGAAQDPERAVTASPDDTLQRLLDANPLAPPRQAPLAARADVLRDPSDARPVTIPAGSLGNPTALRVLQQEADVDGDGRSEELRFFDQRSGELVRRVRDENGDRRADLWDAFEGGALRESTSDPDGDGRPNVFDLYSEGHLALRRIDREGDGSIESQYRYDGTSLAEERHDGNADGAVDLIVTYRDGRRAKSEEDRDLDGRSDTWSYWVGVDGREQLARVERDRLGRGRPDVVEHYELLFGQPVLSRVEEDRDGDGSIDTVQRYERGERIEDDRPERAREVLTPL
jgi:hypothetical protein